MCARCAGFIDYELVTQSSSCGSLCSPLVLQLSEVVEHTRSIKKSVEVALSKQFNGRRVNVLGEINNALASTAQSAYTYSDP